MRKRNLLSRIEELERRLAEVEARPMPTLAPIHIPAPTTTPHPYTYPYAWWGIVPPPQWGTCGTTANGVSATNATNAPHSVGHTFTGSPC